MKTLLKFTTCMIVALLSFSIYSCGNDNDDAKSSVNELIGIWEGVTKDEWAVENGKRDEDDGRDISDMRYELKLDMTFNYSRKYNNTWTL